MPNSEDRRIFLAKPVIDWLKSLPKIASEFVFPAPNLYKGLTANAIDKYVRDLHKKKKESDGKGWIDPNILDIDGKPKAAVLHGMRSSYRTWCADCDGGKHEAFNRDAVEFNLLHNPMGKVERAYNRAPLEKQRRQIMEAWAEFCLSKVGKL